MNKYRVTITCEIMLDYNVNANSEEEAAAKASEKHDKKIKTKELKKYLPGDHEIHLITPQEVKSE